MKNYKRLENEIIIVNRIDVLALSGEFAKSELDTNVSNVNGGWKLF